MDEETQPEAGVELMTDPSFEHTGTEQTGQPVPAHWNDTGRDYAFDRMFPDLFAAQAARIPQTTALVFQGQHLTFEQLNQRANQCAHYLQKQGVRRDSLVAICMDRSLELEIVLLGILKAGAGYLPLDPSHPRDRLAFILQESNPVLVITQHVYQDRLSENDTPLFVIDRERDPLESFPSTNPDTQIQGDDLAYVIYTSGSTGRPKGVMIEHKALLNQLLWMQETFQLTADDRVLQKSPNCFDMSVWELFGPFLGGARLIMASPNGHKDPQYLVDTIQGENITTIHFVPSMFEIFLEHPRCADCQSLRRILCGGEALPGRLIERFNSLFSGIDLFNTYGPTETTITASWWDCRRYHPQEAVPIGRPVANTQIYIVDPKDNPVPIGTTGELCIAGAQLARGYLDRPDLSRSQFGANPFDSFSDTRLYRTGDLCRYRPDGNIEFLGRLDHQVKIRGFRIECGEIEAALIGHPEIRQAVVLAREDHPGDKQLVAYWVGTASEHSTDLAFEEHLKKYLPTYMIPAAFVFLTAIPLSANGKIDRKALPAPEKKDAQPADHEEPRTDLQKALAGLYCDLLSLERVSLDASFFQLGGHSLLAAKLTYRIQAAYPVPLTIIEVFQRPTVAGLAQWIEAAMQMDAPRPERTPIPLVPYEKIRRLSFSQQRLWVLYELDPDSAFYNVPFRLSLTGPLIIPALENALSTLMERHEILRTGIVCQNGEPRQFVRQDCDGLLTCHECKSTQEIEQHLTAYSRKPFDLTNDLLIQCHLYTLDQDNHILLVVMHHIVTDGASVRIFLDELGKLYSTYARGQSPSLDAPSLQYADYAQWQRDQINALEYEAQWQYWQKKLADLETTELPPDTPRPLRRRYGGATESTRINGAFKKAILSLAHQRETTLFITLLAVCKVLLHRYTHRTDLVVGTPTANRTRQDLENVMGFFVNTVVLRTTFSEDASFPDILEQVHTTCMEAQANQDIPFEQLVNRLQIERDLSRGPLFQIMFLVQQDIDTMITLDGLSVQYQNQDTATSKFDLCFIIEETLDTLTLKIEYDTELYQRETVRHLLEHYKTVLAGVVANPNGRIAEFPLMTERECSKQLIDWGSKPRDYPRERCVHELFEDQAAQDPDATALSMDDQSLSYGQLNARANQLAHYLQGQGFAAGQRAGVFMKRCPDLIVAFLAILKAGGSYVPLDPSSPPKRRQWILDETRPGLVLTQAQKPIEAPAIARIDLGDEDVAKAISEASDQNLDLSLSPNAIAYIMYTSGSTGRPKGVAVKHRGITRLLFGIDYVDFSEKQVLLQLAPASFDASTFEIWGALLHGHSCVLYPDELPDLDRLGALLKEHRVSILWLTASLFNLIIDDKPTMLAGISQLITGGEALSVPHVRRAMRLLPRTQIINGYGPTESTTFACCYRIPRSLPGDATSIPIGRPIANTTCLILDAHQNPVPVGVPGELYIGGDGLAEGYVERPDLTAERFVKNPLDPTGPSRLYKTGDICRWSAVGLIEFMGRQDDQVKIRGFRIELQEIDATLAQHPGIQRSQTVLHPDLSLRKTLVSYCVAARGAASRPDEEITDHLRKTLPEYMIPSTFLWIDQFPLTANGKVDLKALPTPPSQKQEVSQDHAVLNATEKQLIPLFAEVLNCSSIDTQSHFFKLGGHSLLAIKLFHKIQQTMNKKLPLATLFQAPTIRQLARVIDASEESVSHTSLVKIKEGRSDHPIFILPGLGGHSLAFSHLAEALDLDRPIYGLELQGLDGQEQPHHQIEDMARYFLGLVQSVSKTGPYTLIGYSLGGQIAFEMACQLVEKARSLDALIILSATAPGHAKTSKNRLIHYAYRLGDFVRLPLSQKANYLSFKVNDIKNRIIRRSHQKKQAASCPEQAKFHHIVTRVSKQAMHAWHTYRPRYQYAGDVLLIRNTGMDSPLSQIDADSFSGWDRYVTGSIEKHDIPCGHVEILGDGYVDQLAAPVHQYLVQARQSTAKATGNQSVWTRAPETPNLGLSDVDLYCVQVNQHRHNLATLETTLSPLERDRARAFKYDLHRERFIVRRGLLRQILATYTGQSAGEIPITYSDSGKPMLGPGDNPSDLRFSLSHRNDTVLYAFACQRDIGIDLEFLTRDPELPKLAENHFSPQEYQALCQVPTDQQSHRFYALWTCKEAYLKARGIIPLETFTITMDSPKDPLLTMDTTDGTQVGQWRFHQFMIDSDGLAALALPAASSANLRFWQL